MESEVLLAIGLRSLIGWKYLPNNEPEGINSNWVMYDLHKGFNHCRLPYLNSISYENGRNLCQPVQLPNLISPLVQIKCLEDLVDVALMEELNNLKHASSFCSARVIHVGGVLSGVLNGMAAQLTPASW